MPGAEGSRTRNLEKGAGWLSLGAAAVHGGVAPEHFAEWWGYGVFFVVAAFCQALFGLLLLTRGIDTPAWPWRRAAVPVAWAGIAGNLLILALWAVTRTVGIPAFGPEAGTVEPVGVPDLLSKAFEVALVVLLALALRRQSGTRAGAAP